MRRSRDTQIIRNEDGSVLGVSMKADYTAEHEFGIDDLNTKLGVNTKKLGIAGRVINRPSSLVFAKTKKGAYLYVPDYSFDDQDRFDKHSELHAIRDCTLSSAWSSRALAIYAKNKEDIDALEDIYNQAQKKNVALGFGNYNPDNPFDRAALNLIIVSKLPAEVVKSVYDADLDYHNLQKAHKRTRLAKSIKSKYKFMAPIISPQWASASPHTRGEKHISETTRYPVVYWLNASKHYGWYTVEEIRQWMKTGKGIIEDDYNKREDKKV